jgi:hypothetical protein
MEQQRDSTGLYKMLHMPFIQKQITDYNALTSSYMTHQRMTSIGIDVKCFIKICIF